METIGNVWTMSELPRSAMTPAFRPEASVDTRPPPRFRIRAASTPRDLREAGRLVDKMYATRGYCTNTALEIETTPRKTFIAMEGDKQVGTLSIGFGCAHRLLAEDLFPEEIATFRNAGHGICEFTKLAVDRRVRSRHLLPSIFHVAYLYARKVRGLSYLLIEVNPRHVRYYEGMLGFKVVGNERHNSRVNAPAVLLSLDLAHAEEQIAKLGGKPGQALTERSAYPFFFSPEYEAEVATRLQGTDNIADVHDLEIGREVPDGKPEASDRPALPVVTADPESLTAASSSLATPSLNRFHREVDTVVVQAEGARYLARRNLPVGPDRGTSARNFSI